MPGGFAAAPQGIFTVLGFVVSQRRLQQLGAFYPGGNSPRPKGSRCSSQICVATAIPLLEHHRRNLAKQGDEAARCGSHLLFPELLIECQVLQNRQTLSTWQRQRVCFNACYVQALAPISYLFWLASQQHSDTRQKHQCSVAKKFQHKQPSLLPEKERRLAALSLKLFQNRETTRAKPAAAPQS